jgi:hypothetical protein
MDQLLRLNALAPGGKNGAGSASWTRNPASTDKAQGTPRRSGRDASSMALTSANSHCCSRDADHFVPCCWSITLKPFADPFDPGCRQIFRKEPAENKSGHM